MFNWVEISCKGRVKPVHNCGRILARAAPLSALSVDNEICRWAVGKGLDRRVAAVMAGWLSDERLMLALVLPDQLTSMTKYFDGTRRCIGI